MKCISSPALDDTQIARYIEDEADEDVAAHIKECSYCSERAGEWSLLRSSLKKQLYRINCPTSIELGDYHLGYLPDPQKLVVAQHVRECVLCRQELAALEGFLAELTPQSNLLDDAKVLVARLISSQAENDFAPALRGEARGPLTFEVDGIVIVLDIQLTKEGMFEILGQLAADEQDKWTGAIVELWQDNELQFSTTVDDLGAFRSGDIGPGSKELRVIPKDGSLILVTNFLM